MGTDLTLAFFLSISRLFWTSFHIQTHRPEESGYGKEESGYGKEESGYGKEESGYGKAGHEESGYGNKKILFLQTLSDSKLTQPLPEAQFVLLSPLAVI